MSSELNDVTANSKDMFKQSQETVNITDKGSETLNTLIAQMREINTAVEEIAGTIKNLEFRSQEISNIVALITDISEQTNLLALNASIEAARAGEHGRGFSVVAQEIRNLAEQTKESAAKISNTVHDIQADTDKASVTMDKGTEKVKQGMGAANEVSSSFELIRDAIRQVLDKVKEVTSAADKMDKESNVIVKEIESIKVITEKNAIISQESSAMSQEQLGATEEMAASSQNLTALAEELSRITAGFKL
jgi:methyl-accepting chemotaxis protein